MVCITHVLQDNWQKPKRLFHKCRTFCSGHAVIFWYKSVYDSNPSLRASSFLGGIARSYTRVAYSQVLSRLASLASRNGELAHRAKLIRDLTRELTELSYSDIFKITGNLIKHLQVRTRQVVPRAKNNFCL